LANGVDIQGRTQRPVYNRATERGRPRDRNRIERELVTDLPVTSRAQAIEKLTWYAQRRERQSAKLSVGIGHPVPT
jgi:hypothetical protein